MSDQDLAQEAEAAQEPEDEFADLTYPGDVDEEAPADEQPEEGSVEEPTEEAPETPEAEEEHEDAEDQDEGEPDFSEYLEQIPEDVRPIVEKYANKRIGKLTSGWQEKLDQAAEHRKTVETFNERLQKEPEAVLSELAEYARDEGYLKDQQEQQQQEAAPEDPGPPPDSYEEPHEFQKWYLKDREYREHLHKQELQALRGEFTERVKPIASAHQQQEAARQQQAIQKHLGLDDEEFAEVMQMGEQVRKDPLLAFKTLATHVRAGKKQKAATVKKKKDVMEAVRGTEERTGLPATGARAARKPTGNDLEDTFREVEDMGLEVPDEFKD